MIVIENSQGGLLINLFDRIKNLLPNEYDWTGIVKKIHSDKVVE